MSEISRDTAKRRLTAQWHEQVACYPLMRQYTPLAVYLDANIERVRAFNLLAAYDKKEANTCSP